MESPVTGSDDLNQPFSDGLRRAPPETVGVSAAGVNAFIDDATRLGVELSGLMVWRAGAVAAEGWWWPYRAEVPHMMHSATKSFLSAGIGLALEDGRFALSDRVVDFFPDHLPAKVNANLAAMTVEDLLTQTSGHAQGASGSVWRLIKTSWIDEFLKIPVVHPPGEVFRYTSANSFLLSAILSRTTGGNAHAWLEPRLLEPLGIEGLTWDVGPEDINPGGNGISCRTADLLKLAILHHQGGQWEGRQILPADWVVRATRPHRGNPHGYHWWMGPGGAYYAYGIFGQFAVVFPEHDAIVVVTASTPPLEETLRSLIWHHFPRAFEAKVGDVGAGRDLAARLSDLRVLPAPAQRPSPRAAMISGKTFVAEPNDDGVTSLRMTFTETHCELEITDARGTHQVLMGLRDWIEGNTTVSGAVLHHGYEPDAMRVVAGAAWLDDDTLEMTWQFVETAFRDQVRISFDGDALRLARSVNTNSRATFRPVIRARLAATA